MLGADDGGPSLTSSDLGTQLSFLLRGCRVTTPPLGLPSQFGFDRTRTITATANAAREGQEAAEPREVPKPLLVAPAPPAATSKVEARLTTVVVGMDCPLVAPEVVGQAIAAATERGLGFMCVRSNTEAPTSA
jgi:hypothetical protein